MDEDEMYVYSFSIRISYIAAMISLLWQGVRC